MTGAGTTQACAACKYQRRKCAPDCPLSPYFPPDQPKRFHNVHRLFGVSNILRILKLVDPGKREDAVKSIVYEADTREKDPVHGCLGVITVLQSQIVKLKEDLVYAREQLFILEQQQQQQQQSAFLQQHMVVQQQAMVAQAHSGMQSLGMGGGGHLMSYSNVVSPAGSASHYDANSMYRSTYADSMRHNVSSFMDYRPAGSNYLQDSKVVANFPASSYIHDAASARPSLDSRPSPSANSSYPLSYIDCGRPYLDSSCSSRPSLIYSSYHDSRSAPALNTCSSAFDSNAEMAQSFQACQLQQPALYSHHSSSSNRHDPAAAVVTKDQENMKNAGVYLSLTNN